ncbi:hypothetical protein NITMOv2_1193 [Nitrospira moscoviensis]|uniref:Uncharacterized protein n=1 Tax=Nitrospira moscoviensis TaxID=42253 RepID=A0A0K2G9H2_NITMO|nr:hypothetical protein NITMOv2_1193 [Nitrospira moscoviensis]
MAPGTSKLSYVKSHTRLWVYPVGLNYEPSGSRKRGLAGALGFEPRLSVLETDVLPLTLCPYSDAMRGTERAAIRNASRVTHDA